MTIYLAPPATDAAAPVGGQLWRKQVLKKGPLQYQAGGTSRTLNFDDEYLGQLQAAFREGAYDTVPFVLADEQNRHTMAPERQRGEVVDVEATPTGLDAIVRLSGDAERIVRDNPKFGVSARIVEGLTRADGKSWPKAMQHVLGTFDPKMTGLEPWRSVDLAAEGHEVVDLTTSTYEKGESAMPELTEEEVNSLRQLAGVAPSLVSFMQAMDEDDGEDESDVFDDDEDGEDDEDGAGLSEGTRDREPAGIGLSNPADPLQLGDVPAAGAGGGLFDLSNNDDAGDGWGDWNTPGADAGAGESRDVQLSALNEELGAVRTQLAGEQWQKERAELAHAGVPPAMLDKADVLLSNPQAGTVELSTGQSVDAAQVVRDVLNSARGVVDLSAPLGHQSDQGEDTELAKLHAELDKVDI